jgi:transcriptional regulator with XRE-family HTH domain
MTAGHNLRTLRRARHLTVRDVEQATLRLAKFKDDKRFIVSNGWLTRLERGVSGPSIHKLFSLSIVYNVSFLALLKLYDVDINESEKFLPIVHSDSTQLLSPEIISDGLTVSPSREEQTQLVGGGSSVGIVLSSSVRSRVPDFITYGYIGLKDFTMYPLIRPGAFVRIDVRQKRVESQGFYNEYDRPIYFIELRGGYACGWCELQEKEKELVIIPHQSSRAASRHFSYPREAEVVGRVVSFDTGCVDSDSVRRQF